MLKVTGGQMRSRKIRAPDTIATRPTTERVRQRLFDLFGPDIKGARVLDLFAGSGAIGIEALSRGAASATFVENHRAAISTIRTNLLQLELHGTIIPKDALTALKVLKGPYDLIYIDPPYKFNTKHIDGNLYNEALILEIDRLNLASGLVVLEEEKYHISSPEKLPLQNLTFQETRPCGDVRLHIFSKRSRLS